MGFKPPARIRPIAIGILRHRGRFLVMQGFESAKRQHFFRPPGGGVEFQEQALDALRREFREEFGAELAATRLVKVIENLFEFEGLPGHEIVFVFEARFQDPRLYERESFTIVEDGAEIIATWKTLEELSGKKRPLYPDGLLGFLLESEENPIRDG